jgi:hypothetical protein
MSVITGSTREQKCQHSCMYYNVAGERGLAIDAYVSDLVFNLTTPD